MMVNKVNVAEDIRNATFQLGEFGVTAIAGAATLHRLAGRVRTEAVSTAAEGTVTWTITNSHVTATDMVQGYFSEVSGTGGSPVQGAITPGAGSFTFIIKNPNAAAFSARVFDINFWVLKRS